MRFNRGIEIDSVLASSPAERSGLQPGDILLSVNRKPLYDVIDYMFHKDTCETASGTNEVVFTVRKKGSRQIVHLRADHTEDLGLTLKPLVVKTCRNNCIFCFVKQLPRGLRKSLYIKDEDYRLSFLYGNYITLSNMDAKDKKRIVEKRLSPLYISVHTTNKTLRNKMLGNSRAADIMKELKFFAEHKIRMHIQVVLCPGFNDGKELGHTIRDLYKYFPYTSSIAVVPVGLTKYRAVDLKPVEKDDAIKTIQIIESFQKRFMKKHGDPFVYCADELYIKAGLSFPRIRNYGSFPQVENGVGMVPLFNRQARKVNFPDLMPKKVRFLTFTGTSFYPFLNKLIQKLREKKDIAIEIISIENTFFGSSVTCAGLLTGRDIIKSFHGVARENDILIVPDVVLNEDKTFLIDSVSLVDIENALGVKVVTTDSSPQGLVNTISNCC
jgi:putative radical SAM enzyme (TIGR03279 family)